MRFEVLVEVQLRPGTADPQGVTIERALPALGFEGIDRVRVGKAFRFEIEAPDEAVARDRSVELADRLLANPIIEDARVLDAVAVPGPTTQAGAPSSSQGPLGASA